MSKAISNKYKCNPCKKGLNGNEYIQFDIDRFIGYLEAECKLMKTYLDKGLFIGLEDSITAQIVAYEGMLGMIKANSFK